MPTGYTAEIYEGKPQTFQEFALRCARNFGALIMMRDDSLDAPIPDEFKPAAWYGDQVAKIREQLAETAALSDAEATDRARFEHAKETVQVEDAIAEREVVAARYRAMLAEVEAWQPPTEDHQGMKTFMREQLESSIKGDCDGGNYWRDRLNELRNGPPTGAAWKTSRVSKLSTLLASYLEDEAKEVERTDKRNRWVRELRESLAPTTVTQ